MESIKLNHINFHDIVSFTLLGHVREGGGFFDFELFFGKCYCFDSELGYGGWGLSWLIAGQINPYKGNILYNNNELKQDKRRKLSQCVGMDVNDYWFLGKKTIKKQIEKGLKITKNKNASSLKEIMEKFKIDKERVDRTIEHVSALRFPASMGIGYSFDKKIFCFPWIWPTAIIAFKDLWLKELVDFLKRKKCLIIIPTKYAEVMKDLFDEVIEIRQPIS